jgi:DNA-binding transcriptional ArsR family regulator
MFLTSWFRSDTIHSTQEVTMSSFTLQLFKSLSDETRLGIVLLLKEMGELCVRSLHGAGTVAA